MCVEPCVSFSAIRPFTDISLGECCMGALFRSRPMYFAWTTARRVKYAHAVQSHFADVSILLVKVNYCVPRGLQCPEAQPPGQFGGGGGDSRLFSSNSVSVTLEVHRQHQAWGEWETKSPGSAPEHFFGACHYFANVLYAIGRPTTSYSTLWDMP